MSDTRALLMAWLDGDRDPQTELRLTDALRRDPGLLKELHDHELMGRDLTALANRDEDLARTVLRALRGRSGAGGRRQHRRISVPLLSTAIAALLLLGLGLLWLRLTAEAISSPPVWGWVVAADQVRLERADRSGPPRLAEAILPGDRLEVGSDGRLVLLDQRGARIQANGILRIPHGGTQLRLELEAGVIDCEVAPQNAPAPWRVRSPHCTLTIIGTRFSLRSGQDGSVVQVHEGRVHLSAHAGTRDTLLLDAGQSRRISANGLMQTPAAGQQSGVILPEPLMWWPCDEADGRLVADHGRLQRHAATVAAVRRVPGLQGGAVAIAGHGMLQVPDHEAFDLDRGSIAMWIHPDRPFSEQTALNPNFPLEFFCKNDWNAKRGYELLHPAMTDASRWGLRISRPEQASSGAYHELPDELRWMHIAATWGDGSIRLYLDGIQVATTDDAGPIPANDMDVRIGNYFHGRIDDIRLYDQALNAAQIGALSDAESIPGNPDFDF